jgi:hypothetical protein
MGIYFELGKSTEANVEYKCLFGGELFSRRLIFSLIFFKVRHSRRLYIAI